MLKFYSLLVLSFILFIWCNTKLLAVEKLSTGYIGFIENKGQILDQNFRYNDKVLFLQQGKGINVQLRRTGFSYDVYQYDAENNQQHFHRIDIDLLGANSNANIIKENKSVDFLNYYNDYGAFENIYTYEKITYQSIYPYIDLEFIVEKGDMVKYNFIVHPKGNPQQIKIKYTGSENIENKSNSLVLKTSISDIYERIPRSYQPFVKNAGDIKVIYQTQGDNIYSFQIDTPYDKNEILVIDPIPERVWGTYYGGANDDKIYNIKTIKGGDNGVVISGYTSSTSNIATTGAFKSTIDGTGDIFVARMAANGSRVWGTYYGGVNASEDGGSLIISSTNDIYFSFQSQSQNLATSGAEKTVPENIDFVLVKMTASGSRVWASYYGGPAAESLKFPSSSLGNLVKSLALSPSEDVIYLIGSTASTSGPFTVGLNAFQALHGGGTKDALLYAIYTNNSQQYWATYFGGNGQEEGLGVNVDNNGFVYISGLSPSAALPSVFTMLGFPVHQTARSGTQDGFLAKFDDTGYGIWATFFGGTNSEEISSIAFDSDNNIIISGYTLSNNNIATANTHQPTIGGARDGFIAKFTPNCELLWSTYYGGSSADEITNIVVKNNAIYALGKTSSASSIATTNALHPNLIGGQFDGFLSKFNANGSLQWGTYFGSEDLDEMYNFDIDDLGNIYIGGYTIGTTNITQASDVGIFQTSKNNTIATTYDGFILKYSECSMGASISNIVNATCGQNNGTLTPSITNGVAPYIYLWSNGQTTNSATGLAAGNYSVTITDDGGCVAIATATITQPVNTLVLTPTQTDISCRGDATGSIVVVPSGATAPYTYIWSNGGTTNTINALIAGTYTVTVSSANGCSMTRSFTITQPSTVLAGSTTHSNVSCVGATNGTASVVANGGTTPYSYAWTGGRTGSSITGLSAGTYVVTVSDANSCTITSSVVVGTPSAMVLGGSQTNVLCYGSSTGVATVSVTSGGTSPYSYVWSGGGTSSSKTGLSSGVYTVTVSDVNACTSTRTVTITQPSSGLSTSATVGDISCNGGSTGTINIAVSGGTSPYNYLWSNAATTQNISGLSAGSYTVSITDANGCSITRSSTVNASPALVLTTNKTDISCAGSNNGSITSTVSGGTSPYSYAWTGGRTGSSITGLSAGSYTVTVTDNAGCTITNSAVIITNPPALTATITGVATGCSSAIGSATVSVFGGTLPYTYLWSNNQTTITSTGLSAGSYTVTITDANACSISQTYIVASVSNLMGTVSNTPAGCGANNGTATVIAQGGSGVYTYVWSNGATTSSISGLGGGTYTVTISDNQGCQFIDSTIITSGANGNITLAIASQTSPTCFGGNNGIATINVSNAISPLSYLWSNGQTTAMANNLASGSYGVTVTDANGCVANINVIMTQPQPIISNLLGTNISCYGANNGAISSTVSGGVSPYSYIWSNGATSANIQNLSAGGYAVTITDVNGCEIRKNTTIIEPTTLTINTNNITHLNCSNTNIGAISTSVNGGVSPYSYVWSNGATSANIQNLSAGIYIVTVTDANACNRILSVEVLSPSASFVASVNSQNVFCNTTNNGQATVVLTGGVAPYSYIWSNGATVSTITGLNTGYYEVTVTDANNCMVTANTNISNMNISLSITPTHISCYGGSDASIYAEIMGGVPPYTYNWSNGQVGSFATNLSMGEYIVTATDASGCNSVIETVMILQPAEIFTAIGHTGASCIACVDGTASVTVSGGVSPYTYNWTTGATTASIENLGLGTYFLTVTDANGCIVTTNTNIPLSIENIIWNDLKIYPNPTIAMLNIENIPANTTIRLVDILGRVMHEKLAISIESNVILDMQDFIPNIYLLQFVNDEFIHTVKIIRGE